MARHLKSFLFLLLAVILVIGKSRAQSNYGIQGIDQEYTEGLPPKATLAGKVTELDTLQPQITLNRTQALLNCAAGSMHVELRFKEPFYGIAYSDFDRNSACYSKGNGLLTTTLELPLKGCGTRQDPQRVFTNNIVVRFHHGLEMEGDEVITIVCRYPPPIVPAPPSFLYIPPGAAPPILPKPLKEFEVLLIICAILFLGLMLLGLGCSYYCLKQRNIQVIRKRPFSPVEDESERLSTIESFSALKIPRVHAVSTESSSDVPLEETLASDYPSSIDEPHRPETVSSEYSDTHVQVDSELIPAAVKKPHFAVNLRVAKQPSVVQFSEDSEGSITSVETGVAIHSHVPDLHPPPRRRAPPPIMARVQSLHEPNRSVQHTELVDTLTVVDKEDVDTETKYTQPLALARKPEVSVHTVDDVYLQTIVEKRLIEDEERRTREVTQFYKKEQPKWDVVIRSHPVPDDDQWDRGSETTDVASSIGWSVVEEAPIRPHYSILDRETISRRTDVIREDVDRTTVSRAMQKLQEDDARVWNERWKVLLRVLESPPPPPETASDITTSNADYDSETASVLTEDDREKWRQIITTESTLRTLLTQATVREDYERIRRDTRYEKLFEPEKWDVIIRVLAPPDQDLPDPDYDGSRFYSDSQSEVSSVAYPPSKPTRNYRKFSSGTTNTEMKSMTDVRSMTEVMVDFAVDDPLGRDDDSSIVSSYPGNARSVADRSSTEIVEFAPLDEEDDDFDDMRLMPRSMRLPDSGISNNNFSTQEHRVSQRVDDDGNLVQEATSSRKVFSSSSRVHRY